MSSPATSDTTSTNASVRTSSVGGRSMGSETKRISMARMSTAAPSPPAPPAPATPRHPRRAPRRREAETLRQQLADDAAAAGAEGKPDRHLSGSRRRSREEQVAEV